jgi:hypothetical protein
MSYQFSNYVRKFDLKLLSLYNKKKNIIKDKVMKITINPEIPSCQLCGKPPGKLNWCKHIYFFLLQYYQCSPYRLNLIGTNKKYIDSTIAFEEECCICLDEVTEIEHQCIQCAAVFHTRCLGNKIGDCPVCRSSIKISIL